MRLRARYAKLGKVRFTSHRDTARIWERALRRAGVPVATSRGFTPRPRLSFGLALPTGAESTAEYLDIDVDGALDDLDRVAGQLGDALPAGFCVLVVAERDERGASLQECVTSVTWELSTPAGADLAAVVDRLLTAEALPLERERKGERRVDDIRPQLVSLVARDSTLVADVATTGRGLRPSELLTVAFPDAEVRALRALRTHQWIEHDGNRREVLALPVPAPLVGA